MDRPEGNHLTSPTKALDALLTTRTPQRMRSQMAPCRFSDDEVACARLVQDEGLPDGTKRLILPVSSGSLWKPPLATSTSDARLLPG